MQDAVPTCQRSPDATSDGHLGALPLYRALPLFRLWKISPPMRPKGLLSVGLVCGARHHATNLALDQPSRGESTHFSKLSAKQVFARLSWLLGSFSSMPAGES